MVLQVLCETGFLGLVAFIWSWFTIVHMSVRDIFSVSPGKQVCIRLGAFCGIVAALVAGMFGWLFVHGVQETLIVSCALALSTDAFTL
jgi:hypothetical protein